MANSIYGLFESSSLPIMKKMLDWYVLCSETNTKTFEQNCDLINKIERVYRDNKKLESITDNISVLEDSKKFLSDLIFEAENKFITD